MDKPLFLRIFRGADLIGIKQFNATQVVIGREGEIDIKLEGNDVSPIHAMIERRENGFFLCDLGSETGVTLLGKKILDEPIESSSEFLIGPYRIEFYEGIPKPKSKPPPVVAPPTNKMEKDDIYDQPTKGSPQSTPVPEINKPEPKAEIKPTPVVESQPVMPPAAAPVTPAAQPPKPVEKPAPAAVAKPEDVSIPDRPNRAGEIKNNQNRPKENQVYHVSGNTSPSSKPKVSSPAPSASFAKVASMGGSVISHRKHSTFAPPSKVTDLNDVIKPEKGTTVEIVIAWQERIIETYHYNEKQTIKVGSHPKNDIVLPVFGSTSASHPLVKIESLASVFLTPDMKGVHVKNGKANSFESLLSQGAVKNSGAGYVIDVQQGEMVRIDFDGGVSIYIRYISQTQKPLIGPILDLTANELVNILIAIGLVAIFMLYVVVFSPEPTEAPPEELDEAKRIAIFSYVPKQAPIEPVEAPTPPPEPRRVKVTEKKQEQQVQKRTSDRTEGQASDAPKTNSTSEKKILTAANAGKDTGIQRGGKVNQGTGQEAQGSPLKDVNKSGLLGAIAKGGTQDNIRSATAGAGQIGGAAEVATGSGSKAAAGAGTTPGGGLAEVGKGGQGESTYGISGVNTSGKGGGKTGYGTGDLGTKASVSIIPGGDEEVFEGGIDREEVRRVVLRNLPQLKNCYERVTRVDPTIGGKVLVNWTIEAGGRVGEAKIASTEINNSSMMSCILSRLRSWRFPEPPEGQVGDVTYPFVFAPTSN